MLCESLGLGFAPTIIWLALCHSISTCDSSRSANVALDDIVLTVEWVTHFRCKTAPGSLSYLDLYLNSKVDLVEFRRPKKDFRKNLGEASRLFLKPYSRGREMLSLQYST